MHKLAAGISVGVVLFVLILTGIVIIRGRTAPRAPAELPPTRADYRITEIRLQEERNEKVRWKLDADQAEVFEKEGKTILRQVTLTIQEPDRTWKVSGEEGDLVDATKDVAIRKNVVLVSSDGTRLETDHLRWQAKEKRVWTDAPVTLYGKGAMITGKGLETWLEEERTAVRGPVRAIFARTPSGLLALPLASGSAAQ